MTKSGNSQAVRPPTGGLARAFELLTELPDDFLAEGRGDAPPQRRDPLTAESYPCRS